MDKDVINLIVEQGFDQDDMDEAIDYITSLMSDWVDINAEDIADCIHGALEDSSISDVKFEHMPEYVNEVVESISNYLEFR